MAAQIYTGTVSVNELVPAEVTVKELAFTVKSRITSVWLLGYNLTVGATAKLYKKDAGGTYRQINPYDTVMGAGQSINLLKDGGVIDSGTYVKVTIISAGLGAGSVNLEYEIPYDTSVDKLQSVFNGTGDADDVDMMARSLTLSSDAGSALNVSSSADNAMSVSSSNGDGIYSVGSGAGAHFLCASEGNGDGLVLEGAGTGAALVGTAGATGVGVSITATADDAVQLSGGGSGNGLKASGGLTGHGMELYGGGTSGHGLFAHAQTSGRGLYALAAGGFSGIVAEGSGTGNGIYAISGDGAIGDGIKAIAISVNGNGFYLSGSGTGHALQLVAGATGNGIDINTTAGNGVDIDANGAASKGININSEVYGLYVLSSANNGDAVALTGNGTGAALHAYGGATGIAIRVEGGGTSGDGINITTTNGHGIIASATGAGKDALKLEAGATGNGINAIGGATSGHGIRAYAQASGDGLNATSADGNGIYGEGGNGGNGLFGAGEGNGAGANFEKGLTGVDINADELTGLALDATVAKEATLETKIPNPLTYDANNFVKVSLESLAGNIDKILTLAQSLTVNRITNGTFAVDASWTKDGSATISLGVAHIPADPPYSAVYQNWAPALSDSGKTFILGFTVASNSVRVLYGPSNVVYAPGTYAISFTWTSGNSEFINFNNVGTGAAGDATVDNVMLYSTYLRPVGLDVNSVVTIAPTDMALNSTVAKEATLNTKIPTNLSFTGANVNADSKVTAAPTDMALNSTVSKAAGTKGTDAIYDAIIALGTSVTVLLSPVTNYVKKIWNYLQGHSKIRIDRNEKQ